MNGDREGPKHVWTNSPTGKNKGVVIVRICIGQDNVHRELIAEVHVVEAPTRGARTRRYQHWGGSGLLKSLPRLGELDLLYAVVVREKCYALSFKIGRGSLSHLNSPWVRDISSARRNRSKEPQQY